MKTQSQTMIWVEQPISESKNLTKSTLVALTIHLVLLLMQFSSPTPIEEPEEEPLTVNLVSFPPKVEPQITKPEVKKVKIPEVVKPVAKAQPVVAKEVKPLEKTDVLSANFPLPNAKAAPERLNPHHTSASPASPTKVAQTKHPGPEVTKDGPETAKFRAKNPANQVAHDSTGPGGPGKVGGPTGGGPETGVGQTYKGFNFKSAMNGMLAKGSGRAAGGGRNGQGNGGYGFQDGSEFGSGIEKVVGSSDGAAAKLSKVSGNGVGNLADAAAGKLDGEAGAAGLVSKKGLMSASLPAGGMEVMGGMDPDAIRRALQEALPQFRSCYQRELDSTYDASEGSVTLHFFIAGNGRVSQSNIKGRTLANENVNDCVLNVLGGIQFPKPPISDAVVEVEQPLNFYTKKI